MVIGIVGRKRHGKDTIADYLVNNLDYEKYSFANPLKRGAMEMFGFTEEQVFGDLKDEIDPLWGCKPREVLQVLGTELLQFDIQKYLPAFQNIGRLIWVRNFMRFYENNPDKNIVIADVRFKHEAKTIQNLGGKVIKIVRPGMPDGDFHASEVEIDEIDYDQLIINDSNLAELYDKVKEIDLVPNDSIRTS